MSRRLRLFLVVLAAALVAAPAAATAQSADTPTAGALYHDGPDGRYLMSGTWLFRGDPRGQGLRAGWMRNRSTAGWSAITVPSAWNATDESRQSFNGTVGWYRKDFRLPNRSRSQDWLVRFESVNYRARVWLNGRPLGENRGAYLPFELHLPAERLNRNGVNRLVVRVDNRRHPTDFPPSNLDYKGNPTGGWWNYGGLLREVYLRRVDKVDFATVTVRPDLACTTCSASVLFRVLARNYTGSSQPVSLSATYGARRVSLGAMTIPGRSSRTFTARLTVPSPRLWSPASPYLYDVRITARQGGRVLRRYELRSGARSIKVRNGVLLLNGQQLNLRGVALHEDSLERGFAQTNADRDRQIAWSEEIGATILRSHYPLHPYTHEQADRKGLLIWSEIPVYAVKTHYLKQRLVRELAAKELRTNIEANGNHPSILVWSIANELSAKPGPTQADYIARAARTAKELDPGRPVGLAVAGYPNAGCQPEYRPLQVIGVNTYFGWYPGPSGQLADRTLLGDYLDQVRRCYPRHAIMATEFGVEANREGPVEEKGTYAFQEDWINYTLSVFDSKPWLSGAIYWTLQEFRVRPDWEGGNPRPGPNPVMHQKAVITLSGDKKPGFFDLQRAYRATQQFRAPGR